MWLFYSISDDKGIGKFTFFKRLFLLLYRGYKILRIRNGKCYTDTVAAKLETEVEHFEKSNQHNIKR